eukprot:jgi/Picre1/29758/NNA_005140.t1
MKKIFTLEFDRKRKLMSTLCEDSESGQLVLYCKGAPEIVLGRCTSVLAEDGSQVALQDSLVKKFQSQIEHFAREGLFDALHCVTGNGMGETGGR